jgi:hypothetical protein
MLDVRPLLEGTRDKKAKVFWMCGSKTSLFGWVYMKLKYVSRESCARIGAQTRQIQKTSRAVHSAKGCPC